MEAKVSKRLKVKRALEEAGESLDPAVCANVILAWFFWSDPFVVIQRVNGVQNSCSPVPRGAAG